MYENYFGLTCRPFDLAPDPRFVYMTEQHSRAVANLRFALLNRDSFVIITGEIGIGKTTILNTVMAEVGPGFVTARLTHTTLSHIELLQALLSEFGMPMYEEKKVLLLDTLRSLFLKKHEEGQHVVIIVDEAQNLSASALEELRLLSCIDTADRKILTIALTGQPSLDEVLDVAGLTQLRQRARLRQRLHPLTVDETVDYVRHRLSVAGGNMDKIFDLDAVRDIHRLTQGIPRLINTLCDTALTACMVDERPTVTLHVLDDVVRELRWTWFQEPAQLPAKEELTARGDLPAREEMAGGQVPPANARPGRAARIRLMVYKDGQFVEQLEPREFPFLIGRTHANNLAIIDKEVSRRHACIQFARGTYMIEDLNSKNGILVNGKKQNQARLRSGDVITIGPANIIFYADRAGTRSKPRSRQEPEPPIAVEPEMPPQSRDPEDPTIRQKKIEPSF